MVFRILQERLHRDQRNCDYDIEEGAWIYWNSVYWYLSFREFFCFCYFQRYIYVSKNNVLVFLLAFNVSFACVSLIDFCIERIKHRLKARFIS